MKFLFLTQGQPDACLQAIMEQQARQHEVVCLDLALGQWDGVLDQVVAADQVISWLEEP